MSIYLLDHCVPLSYGPFQRYSALTLQAVEPRAITVLYLTTTVRQTKEEVKDNFIVHTRSAYVFLNLSSKYQSASSDN